MAKLGWEDALIHLHEMGWDTDDIDAACDQLVEACTEGGEYEGNEPSELDAEQLEAIFGGDVSAGEQRAVVVLAELRAQEDPESDALQEALWDLEDFADGR